MRAVTHRRGGLKVASHVYDGCSLFGWAVSPYTAKVRSLLAHKNISFSDVTPSMLQMALRVKPSVGRLIMPSVRLSNGEWRQDSALICDEIEREHPEPSTKPAGAAQQLASSLLELHADEWLPMLALHSRWNNAANAEWAVGEFARCAFPWLPSAVSSRLVAPVAAKMQSFRKVHGAIPTTHDGIDRCAQALIGSLERHFAASEAPPFLLGGRPCRADHSLYGPLWAHCYRDPHSRALFGDAPAVVAWMERLHGHASDPAFPELPCRQASTGSPPLGDFLGGDCVPETLDSIFRDLVFAESWPFYAELSAALDAHLDEASGGSGGGGGGTADVPEAVRVPRALGYAPFTVGGTAGERRRISYSAWRLQRPLDLYRSLELAPSRALELASVNKWLGRLGALDSFRAVHPRWRLERENALPLEQETLWASRHRA